MLYALIGHVKTTRFTGGYYFKQIIGYILLLFNVKSGIINKIDLNKGGKFMREAKRIKEAENRKHSVRSGALCAPCKSNTRGITLIALVITVIVLLILAGAAVSVALNGDNVFEKANEAKTSWNAKVEEENGINNTLA